MELYLELRDIAQEVLFGTGKTFKSVMKDIILRDPSNINVDPKINYDSEENVERAEQIFRTMFYKRM